MRPSLKGNCQSSRKVIVTWKQHSNGRDNWLANDSRCCWKKNSSTPQPFQIWTMKTNDCWTNSTNRWTRKAIMETSCCRTVSISLRVSGSGGSNARRCIRRPSKTSAKGWQWLSPRWCSKQNGQQNRRRLILKNRGSLRSKSENLRRPLRRQRAAMKRHRRHWLAITTYCGLSKTWRITKMIAVPRNSIAGHLWSLERTRSKVSPWRSCSKNYHRQGWIYVRPFTELNYWRPN